MSQLNSSSSPNSSDAAPIAAPAQTVPDALAYEAPAIESILSPNDLQREVLYAGVIISDPGGPIIPV